MWIKSYNNTKWYNLDQIFILTTNSTGQVYAYAGGASEVVRDFDTQSEANDWVADVLDNIRED